MRHAISAGALLLSAAASAHEVAPPVTPQAEVQPEPAAFKPPVIKKRVEPDYPESAMKDGITGTVVLQIGIDESGRVVEARVERGVRDDVDAAALAAVKQLEFEPARAGKEPVRVRLVYEQTFALHAAAPPPVTPKEPVRAAPETRLRGPYEATVRAERPLTAASATTVRDRDFLLRPHPRPADVLRVAPGLMVVQHAGGGKANQYFLRGFDADHGSDVALSFDGVPANAVSHGHGQGYADLNWVIPELVERIEVRKGLYFAVDGDFATAGAIDLQSRRAFDRSSLTLGGGAFATLRALAIASPKMDGLSPLFVAEAYATDGPFRSPERLQRYSLFAKVTHDLSASASVSVAATACAAGWNASGQVPLREVQAGRLDRFGTVDPSDGGGSERHSVYLALRAEPAADSSFEALAYVVPSGSRSSPTSPSSATTR
jgi:TonB family protein